jgi:predicted lipoprotein with Yx(FWY)xxD motif
MKTALRASAVLLAMTSLGLLGTASAHQAHSAAASKAKLQVRSGNLGRFIVDARGMTLYLFEKDRGGKSACSGSCAKVWAPYLTTGKATAGSGVTASRIGTTKRTDGTTQVTYGAHPLYHFAGDHRPGQTAGQGSKAFGASWYVVAPSGKKIDKS